MGSTVSGLSGCVPAAMEIEAVPGRLVKIKAGLADSASVLVKGSVARQRLCGASSQPSGAGRWGLLGPDKKAAPLSGLFSPQAPIFLKMVIESPRVQGSPCQWFLQRGRAGSQALPWHLRSHLPPLVNCGSQPVPPPEEPSSTTHPFDYQSSRRRRKY